jgi:hypothetical protein
MSENGKLISIDFEDDYLPIENNSTINLRIFWEFI